MCTTKGIQKNLVKQLISYLHSNKTSLKILCFTFLIVTRKTTF